jgi:predicted Rossmann fold flavoprotein
MEHFDLIIIGGGAAGLFLRANLKKGKALLLESTDQVGRKLLLTGGGMCNITNTRAPEHFLTHFATKGQRNFLLPALLNFTPENTRHWFEDHGLPTIAREDGKVFPRSLKSRDVLSCLLDSGTCPIYYNEQVTSIQREDGHFIIQSTTNTYTAKKVVITTGGMSVSHTGSDGSGYHLAKMLGHAIESPNPALVGLAIQNWNFSDVSGTSLQNVTVTATHSGETKPYHKGRGDVLFTHRGLSGPAILTLSGAVRRNDLISITVLENPIALFESNKGAKTILGALREHSFTRSFAQKLLVTLGIDENRRLGQIRKDERKALIRLLGGLSFVIEGTLGFQSAMVTRGGVTLGEVDRKRMESKICPNLFFCGEVLDYDGESGGYNLQGAFSTAMLAAQFL